MVGAMAVDRAARAAAARLAVAPGLPADRRRHRDGEPGDVAVGARAQRRPRGETLREQIASLAELIRDRAFLRLAVCLGASQCAAIALTHALDRHLAARRGRLHAGRGGARPARGERGDDRRLSGVRACRRSVAKPRTQRTAASRRWCGDSVAVPRLTDSRREQPFPLVPLCRGSHRGRARLLDLVAALSEGDGGSREHGDQRVRFRGLVRRPMGDRRGARPLAAERSRLCRGGLPVGARPGVGGAARRPGLDAERPRAARAQAAA